MYLTRITFPPADRKNELQPIAESYLAAVLKNGQICGEYLFAWCGEKLVAYTHVLRPDALAESHHSEWAMRDREVVLKEFGSVPDVEVLEDDVPAEFPLWERSESFYLFTNAFDDSSPVCCGDTGKPVPLYLLPVDQQLREQLYFWMQAYKHHDHIWLGSAALEMPAYRQLAEVRSELSGDGRQLCAQVERATRIPTYYFLHRYYGRLEGETMRLCPGCGNQWHTGEAEQDLPFHRFHFRCESCRLVSVCGPDGAEEEHAEIGEFMGEPVPKPDC